jgi:beta-galactosidase
MWSLGNETGFGPVYDRVLRFMRTLDNTRLIHYERINNARYNGWGREQTDMAYLEVNDLYYTDAVDMANRMYPASDRIVNEYVNDKKEFRPYFLCEYAHCMGNAPGDIYYYVDWFYDNDWFMGGCIWEWADHGLYVEGKKSIRYGGDFGERHHDSNFCCDGLVSADRLLKPGSYEVKKSYQPVVFKEENGELIVKNRNFFASIVGELELCYKNNGKLVKKEKLSVAIEPKSEIKLAVDEYQTLIVKMFVDGSELAFESFNKSTSFESQLENNAVLTENGRYVYVKAGQTTFTFDKAKGEISEIEKNGDLLGEMKLTLFRAPTDNDRNIKNHWNNWALNKAHFEPREVKIEGNKIYAIGHISTIVIVPIAECTLVYEFLDNAVKIDVDYKISDHYCRFAGNSSELVIKDEWVCDIPRIGFEMKESKDFRDIEFYGYRAGSYSDLHHFSVKDVMKEKVKDTYYHYVKPQEGGAHYDCSFAEIKSKSRTIRVEGDGFSFNAKPYSDKELASKMHDDELVSDGTYINIDYFMEGIGSNSCGPLPTVENYIPQQAKKSITVIIK